MDEVRRIIEINARPNSLVKPFKPYFKKSVIENGPTW
jgi:hypothetical protein